MKKKITILFVVVFAGIFLFPVLLTIFRSFVQAGGAGGSVADTGTLGIGTASGSGRGGFSLVGYYDILVEKAWFLQGFWNSVFYAVVITFFNALVCIPAAYAFHEADFKGKGALYFFYIILMMMPLQVTMLPNYIGLRDMHLLDTRLALVLPGIFTPFGVFLMSQYMRGLDKSILEAARLETKSVFRIMLEIALPQVKTCVAALFLFTFAENWNLVEQPQIFLKNEQKQPLSVLLAGQAGSMPALFAGCVLFMVPVVVLYLYFHENLEEGLGNLKL